MLSPQLQKIIGCTLCHVHFLCWKLSGGKQVGRAQLHGRFIGRVGRQHTPGTEIQETLSFKKSNLHHLQFPQIYKKENQIYDGVAESTTSIQRRIALRSRHGERSLWTSTTSRGRFPSHNFLSYHLCSMCVQGKKLLVYSYISTGVRGCRTQLHERFLTRQIITTFLAPRFNTHHPAEKKTSTICNLHIIDNM